VHANNKFLYVVSRKTMHWVPFDKRPYMRTANWYGDSGGPGVEGRYTGEVKV